MNRHATWTPAWLLAALLAAGPLRAQTGGLHVVAEDDCGAADRQPHLVQGDDYTFAATAGADSAALTCNFGPRVVYAFDRLNKEADYELELTFHSDGDRLVEVQADGNAVCDPVRLSAGQTVTRRVRLPRKAYAYGQLVLVFECAGGPNAVVSGIRLLSTDAAPLAPFAKEARDELRRMPAFTVDTAVNAEAFLPHYVPVPARISAAYSASLSLNGTWQFAEREDVEEWRDIIVPGEWRMQGFRVDSAAWGRYRRTFRVPADWSSQRVRLRFDGVHSEYEVFVNGRKAGYHLGGMTPYETDVTDALRPGENELTLRVRSESEADMLGSLTQYAAHQLGGILRKVTLFAVPPLHVADLRLVTDLDSLYRDARLRVFVRVANASGRPISGAALQVDIAGHGASARASLPRIEADSIWQGWITVPVAAPKLWDNEHPNLYTVALRLSAGGRPLELVRRRIGFREVEVRGNRLLVNGRAVKLRGVCRHETHPLLGRALTDEYWRRDAELYRAANCNFVRTSHYPPAEEFIERCDELGLFVELEAPVCWVGHGTNENWRRLNYRDPHYYEYIRQANLEAVHFYRNHPSILFWSLANESYWNKGFAQVAEYVRRADPTRPYAFHDQAYGGFNNQGSNAPIANIHYPGPGGCEAAARDGRPMTFGEFCHLNAYNRSELVTDPGVRSDWVLAFAPMWERMYREPAVLGGSVWSGIDDVFQLPEGQAVGYGQWGPIDGWRRPKPEYWDMKKTYSPVRVLTDSLAAGQTPELAVENRQTFSDLCELQAHWSLGGRSGTATAAAPPGATGRLRIPAEAAPGDTLRLSFTDRAGFTVDAYALPVGAPRPGVPAQPAPAATRLRERRDRFVASGRGFTFEVDKATGRLRATAPDGTTVLEGGPLLMALPLTGGGCLPDHNAHTPPSTAVCAGWEATSVTARREGNDVTVSVRGRYDGFEGGYTLRLNAAGTVRADYAFRALRDVNPRQWGLVFEAPAALARTFWRREGRWSVYPADHIARTAGEAPAFYPAVPRDAAGRTEPTWSWSMDANELGSNDFRSTRRNIYYAGLRDSSGHAVTALGGGRQHWRAWVDGRRVRFLVADFTTPGDEMFLGSYFAPLRRPLKPGDRIGGTVVLLLK